MIDVYWNPFHELEKLKSKGDEGLPSLRRILTTLLFYSTADTTSESQNVSHFGTIHRPRDAQKEE